MPFHVAVLAEREIGFLHWNLSYFLYTIEEFLGEDSEPECHWHDEPVEIANRVLGSCLPHENAPKRRLCSVCHWQRWLDHNDAFWLDEDYEEVIDVEDESSETPTESPENGWEEGLEDVTEDDEDSEVSGSVGA